MNDQPAILLDIKRRAVKAAGGGRVLAERLGISQTAIKKWPHIPIERVPLVSEISGFAKHELRPDRPDLFPPPTEEVAA